MPTRREFVKAGAALGASVLMSPNLSAMSSSRVSVAVIGAGAFGGWTALELLRAGAKVTLFDAWGPGNSRASSGGETRVIRATYGPAKIYTHMAAEALRLWKDFDRRTGRALFRHTGVLWMAGANDPFETATLPILRDEGVAFDKMDAAEAARKWPQINFSGVKYVIFEREAGYLFARRACQAVMEAFIAEGGEYRQEPVLPRAVPGGRMQ